MIVIARRSALVALLGMALSGCATSLNTLSEKEIAQLRISEIVIRFGPKSDIQWQKAELAYLAQVPPDLQKRQRIASAQNATVKSSDTVVTGSTSEADRELLAKPESRAFMEKQVVAFVKSKLDARIVPRFKGTRAARLELEVHGFVVPSAVQRVALGGTTIFAAVTTLRDAQTGAELGKLDRMASGGGGQGVIGVLIDQAFDDLEDIMMDTYVRQVEAWLVKK